MAREQDYRLRSTPPLPSRHLAWEPFKEDKDLHATIPQNCRDHVPWLPAEKKVYPVIFWLREPGRALGLDGKRHQRRIDAVLSGGDRAEIERITKVAFRGKIQEASELVIPPPVVAYVNGDLSGAGVWIWAGRNRFELWGNEYQRLQTALANQ